MSDVDAKEVTILSLGAEGGSLDLIGVKDQSGWKFQIRTDKSTLLSLLTEEDAAGLSPKTAGPWARSWDEALDQLEKRYPYWRRLLPLHVEPAFRAQIVAALRAGSRQRDNDGLPEHVDWDRWAILLSDAKEVTILSVGAEEWYLNLVGAKDPSDWRFGGTDYFGWRFRVANTDEAPGSPLGWVRSWEEAVYQLEAYPWRAMVPLHVEPAFRAAIIAAFLRAEQDDANRLQNILLRWTKVLLDIRSSRGRGRRVSADPVIRTLGQHPRRGGLIVAKNGRHGPYIFHKGIIAKIPADKAPDTITLEEAVSLLDGRTLGEHPSEGGLIVVREGRFGPYIRHNGIDVLANKTPGTITLEEAVRLLDARAKRLGRLSNLRRSRKDVGRADQLRPRRQ